MSLAASAIKSFGRLYRVVLNHQTSDEWRCSHLTPAAVRLCQIEQLEPRILLSANLPGFHLIGPAVEQFDGMDKYGIANAVLLDSQLAESPPDNVVSLIWQGQEVLARPDEWLVRFAQPLTDITSTALEVSDLLGLQVTLQSLTMPGFGLLKAPMDKFDDLLGWTIENKDILYIEPNFVYHSTQTFPNDTSFSSLWGLHNTGQSGGAVDADIDAPEAWDITTGSSGVVIGIIDTGIDYNHPDLAGNMWVNPGEIAGDGIDNDGNGFIDDIHGWDFAYDDNDPSDVDGHGTHVAGTIGAVGDNNNGVVGVNWDVKLMALKFLDDGGSGSTADAIDAIQYATMMKETYGVNIVATNNSWGGGGYSSALQDAIQIAGEADILFIAAAGNDGSDNDFEPHYPSNYALDSIISVAATDHNDQRAGFSNYGVVSVDLAAPGESIFSTLPGNSYGNKSGTSMAAPHVTGAAALLAASDPTATALEIKWAILSGAEPISAMANITVTGGRLNVYDSLLDLAITGPRVISISPAPVSPVASEIIITFTEDIAPASIVPANFALRDNGADDLFDTPDDNLRAIGVSDLSQPSTNRIRIDLGGELPIEQYRLILLGTGGNPIRNLNGDALNDGSDYVYEFDVVGATGPYEPNDSIGEATDSGLSSTENVTLSGYLGDGFHTIRDVDIYSFVAEVGDTITADIDASQAGSPLDPILRLFDSSGNELTFNDDTNGLDSFIEYTIITPGTYYVGVSGYSNFDYDPNIGGSAQIGSMGEYSLHLSLGAQVGISEISGNVWADLDRDGNIDDRENGLEGWTVYLDINNNGFVDPGSTSIIASNDVPQFIYDYQTTESQLAVTGIAGAVADLNITFDITHTYLADLIVTLISPSGSEVELFRFVGGSSNNFTNTTLDDEASVPITSGTAPFTGSYQPQEALAGFDDQDPNGIWMLRVYDGAGLDEGMLNSWSLTIETGEPTTQSDAEGNYAFIGLQPGTYVVREVLQQDWMQTFPTGAHVITIVEGEKISDINFGNTVEGNILGDANGDGVVSVSDYASVQIHFGSTGVAGIPGDANRDGVVSVSDYASVQANFGNTSSLPVISLEINPAPAESIIIAETSAIATLSTTLTTPNKLATPKTSLPTLKLAGRKILQTPLGLLKHKSNAIGKRQRRMLSSNIDSQWYLGSQALMQLGELNNYNLLTGLVDQVPENLLTIDKIEVI